MNCITYNKAIGLLKKANLNEKSKRINCLIMNCLINPACYYLDEEISANDHDVKNIVIDKELSKVIFICYLRFLFCLL